MNFKSFANKYDLSSVEIRKEIERAFNMVLSKSFDFEVNVFIKWDIGYIEIIGFPIKNGMLDKITIMPCELSKAVIGKIFLQIDENLKELSVIKSQVLCLRFENEIIQGRVFRIDHEGTLYVSIFTEAVDAYQEIIGYCDLRRQTPKERGTYKIGGIYSFYVLKVKALKHNGVPRLDFVLSRVSKSLVEKLLLSKAKESDPYKKHNIVAIKRVAGEYSHILTEIALPKEIIKQTSDELRERVIVKFKERYPVSQ